MFIYNFVLVKISRGTVEPTQVTNDVTAEVSARIVCFTGRDPAAGQCHKAVDRESSALPNSDCHLHPVHRCNDRDSLPADKKSHQYKVWYYIPFSL